MKPIAVIDLGTNTFQLLVAQWHSQSSEMQVLAHEQRAVQLGKGAMKSNVLQDDALERALVALSDFKQIAMSFQCAENQIFAIGTSILRRAKNAIDFLDKVEYDLQIQVEVISGIQEAELIYNGIKNSLPKFWEHTSLVMDIGGGSVEFILFKSNQVLGKMSLEIGGLQLQSLFHVNSEYDPQIDQELTTYIQDALKPLDQLCQKYKPQVLVGAAGAFETLWDLENASIPLEERVIKSAYPLSMEYFLKHKVLVDQLPYAERVNLPGMKMFRASILPYASALIFQVLRRYDIPEMWVSSFSLKEGYWFLKQSQAHKSD